MVRESCLLSDTWWKIWPMRTETTVMSASAPAQPANVSSLDARAASSAAMKKVLSPSSEMKMSEVDCAKDDSAMLAACAAAGGVRMSAAVPTVAVFQSSPVA